MPPARPLAPGRAPPRQRAPAAPLPPAPSGATDLVLFVSSVEGKPVSRLPLRPGAIGEVIGAVREKGRYVFDTEAVIGITRAEVEMHGRVYERTIAEGHLVRRTHEDFDTWVAKARARETAAAQPAEQTPAAPAGETGS